MQRKKLPIERLETHKQFMRIINIMNILFTKPGSAERKLSKTNGRTESVNTETVLLSPEVILLAAATRATQQIL